MLYSPYRLILIMADLAQCLEPNMTSFASNAPHLLGQILSHLTLEERALARPVCRDWDWVIVHG